VVRDDPIGLRGCVERATALSELGSNHRTVERGSRRSRFSLYEALVNSTEHAHQRRLGYTQLTAQRTNDHVIITVTDHGRWPTAPGNRGRGLPLMYRLADDVHVAVDRDHPGTTISLRWSLSAPNP
jgi:anti-sigma regulatory factor (Ser/Thr protein kinase)